MPRVALPEFDKVPRTPRGLPQYGGLRLPWPRAALPKFAGGSLLPRGALLKPGVVRPCPRRPAWVCQSPPRTLPRFTMVPPPPRYSLYQTHDLA